jgi:molybdenum cofactor cytidylyltransferase
MGRPKQVLSWGPGTIIAEVVRGLRACGLAEVVVVTGAAREEVESALRASAGEAPGEAARVRFVFNPDYATSEMARSLRAGLESLPENCLAALVSLGDQPQLEPDVVRAVVQRWRETQAPVVAPFFKGQRGHPLLFDRAAWPDLMALPPDANPRAFLQAAAHVERVEVETDSILRDIDTPEDYARERPA